MKLLVNILEEVYMDEALRKEIFLKYNQAIKLEKQKEKDDVLLSRIPLESEKLIEEYKVKYENMLNNKDEEIIKLQKQLEEIQSKNETLKTKFSNIPPYIKRIYKI